MQHKLWLLLIIAFLTLTWAKQVSAQQPTPSDDDINQVARQLYCPVCESTPLDVCPTQACAQWRELIREKLAAGWNEEQVKQYFVEQYGARVLAEPPHPLVYIVPPLLLLAGIFILYRTLVSMRKPKPAPAETAPAASPAPVDGDYLHRVEEELKKRH